MAKHYAVLIGDFVQSRNLKNRAAVQRKFGVACAALNEERERLGLVSPLTITLGDEFQAVFTDAARLWECVFRIEAAMAPVEIRFALGLGRIATDVRTDTALGMDGPAFHGARAAMEQMKKTGMRYRIAGLGKDESFVNATLALITHHRLKWRTPRLIAFARLLQGNSVKAISKETRSSEQAVYRNIRDGALDTMLSLCVGIAERMQKILA